MSATVIVVDGQEQIDVARFVHDMDRDRRKLIEIAVATVRFIKEESAFNKGEVRRLLKEAGYFPV